jgi:cytosine/adenosine deaminase-related metal-dependent hydrolase
MPFIVHAAEGVDAAAAAEIAHLDSLGCLRPGTVLVHGVALTKTLWTRLLEMGVSLVWCPASNAFLFGKTISARVFLDAADDARTHLCLGSDSRVTGSRDLLDEMRAACAADSVTATELLRMVTTAPARVLKLQEAGHIRVGQAADLLVIPAAQDTAAGSLLLTTRASVRLVAIGGQPLVADRRFSRIFRARGTDARSIAIDDTEHLADASIANEIAKCPIHEPGVASFS